MSIRPGLCSVTFRQRDPAGVAALAAAAGLRVIEWGGDVHVPPGDAARAAEVARITADAGLEVCSYGSYFRAGPGEEIAPILDSAEALGADRIRVWAGSIGSASATPQEHAAVIDSLAAATAQAAERGIALALEFHGRTLADGPDATLRVLAEVGSPHLSTYWQPTVSAPDEIALAEYDRLADRVSAVHVFSWWPVAQRLPLTGRDELWRGFFARAAAAPAPPRDALLEFVPDDAPEALAAEAAALIAYLA
ncbi:sugar phosphate isomerase/epimerase family protein [Microbacterium sp. ASV81]|uniref:TIM barrel protein n=1 Tax=Microbacterium capsulatum TaxID=3041921 RepID=A0ABU0XL04_9MICO|nr:TIM barrel protein [Microbacterium sp. ASV81]MDQ4215512.1 TIM barrel protein [Microbacterium sp. ASV81]